MDTGGVCSKASNSNNKNKTNNNNNGGGQNGGPIRTIIRNEAHLVRNRCVNFNHKCRGLLDQLCEDKVSKYNRLERLHCSLPSSIKSTFIMTFSPDGRKVASTHGDHCIYICDLNTGKLLDTLYGHPKTPWCLAWHPSNKDILASGCLAGEVRVWDLGSKSKNPESWTSENQSIISSLDFHPKERILVIATANDILFWDWGQPRPFAKTTTQHDKEKVKFVEFDSSGTRLITGILNSPRFSSYSSDSLQNRIIDSYLTPNGPMDSIPSTENMTQNSETPNNNINTVPSNSNNNNNETISATTVGTAGASPGRLAEALPYSTNNHHHHQQQQHLHHHHHQLHNRPSMLISANNNEQQDFNQRTLARIAYLYRQLEALEDSMRHTTFAPYPNSRATLDGGGGSSSHTQPSHREGQQQLDGSNLNQPLMDNEDSSSGPTDSPTNTTPGQIGEPSSRTQSSDSSDVPHQQQQQSIRSSNTYEPFVVSFDESLENLQLSPLVIDGQVINLATILEQYPIEFPNQMHFLMHYESINQVNQNFIRISKLMSSIRLYRQVVQQIISSNSDSGHFQPNQILTAQSTSMRSPRSPSGVPIIFRNLPIGSSQPDATNTFRARPSDPVMAIQFRSSARNVPLVTICKIDLLSARSVCIMRSQQLIEQAIIDLRPSIRTYRISLAEMMGGPRSSAPQASTEDQEIGNHGSNLSFYHLLSQLHQSLTAINHAPLTTSNVHTHISSLRTLVSKLLNALTSLLPTREEGRRLIDLVHDIAHSLTGRSWSIPLGATLDDIRLDVIHTLCIVDLSLHLTRQIQLLQMHRLSAMARIEEYRVNANSNQQESSSTDNTTSGLVPNRASSSQARDSAEDLLIPSTSRESSAIDQQQTKRKNHDQNEHSDEEVAKRRKVDNEKGANNDIEMIDTARETSSSESYSTSQREALNQQAPSASQNALSPTSQPALQGTLTDSVPIERLIVWNSPHGQADEQSLQRFFVATAAGMHNSHILVRIYHTRSGGNSSNILEGPTDRIVSPIVNRRRALSQDNSSASLSGGVGSGGTASSASASQESVSPPAVDSGRVRHVVQNHTPPMAGSPGNGGYETWQRAPHFHVISARAPGQHLWFNQWTISMPMNSNNYRLQCWNFSLDAIPNIKDSQSNIVTQRCRIMNDSSVDLSSDGSLLACLVPRDDGSCMPNLDLKVFSLKSWDFGACYHLIPHGSNAISVSLSPTANYAVVGLASQKYISNDPGGDDLTIAKIFNLSGRGTLGHVRDIKIKRDDSSLILNAIRWMSRGIVYNVGPQHHQRYQAARMRNRFV